MVDKFTTEQGNLFSQTLGDLPEGQIYVATSLISPEIKRVLALLHGLLASELVSERIKNKIRRLLPLMEVYGRGLFEMTELSALGVTVAHKNVTSTKAQKEDSKDEEVLE